MTRVTVSSVDAEVLDVSTAGETNFVLGRTTVELVGGPYRVTVRDWPGARPDVGAPFDLTLEPAS